MRVLGSLTSMSTSILPDVVVPGRANIIGEHTDYNEGLSLAFAVEQHVRIRAFQTNTPGVLVTDDNFGSWSTTQIESRDWHRQVRAVANELELDALEFRVSSSVPVGAGLSSSASFIGALVLAGGVRGDLWGVARCVQRCEARSGSDVGVLDPLAALGSRHGEALLINFATATTTDISLPDGIAFSAVDSGVRRSLSTTAYAQRRRECVEAREILGGWASEHDLSDIADPILRARARHVRSESVRVTLAVAALANSDAISLGEILGESHRSLSRDFDVSTTEIDHLVEVVNNTPGVFGSRLMGGGFGGSLIVAHDPHQPVELAGHHVWPLRAVNGSFASLKWSRVDGSSTTGS